MKLPGYNFGYIGAELEEWRDLVTVILNNGKYQYSTIVAAPNWVGQKGEGVYVMPTTGGTTFYFYRNTAWVAAWSVTV